MIYFHYKNRKEGDTLKNNKSVMASEMLDAMRTLSGEFPELTEFLLRQGANPNLWNANQSPLHAALQRGDTLSAEMLIKSGASCNSLTGASHGSYTPLMVLILSERIEEDQKKELINLLIDHTANVNYERYTGSALHYAVLRNLVGCTQLLLDRGAIQHECSIEKRHAMTPRDLAIHLGHLDIVKLFINRGQ